MVHGQPVFLDQQEDRGAAKFKIAFFHALENSFFLGVIADFAYQEGADFHLDDVAIPLGADPCVFPAVFCEDREGGIGSGAVKEVAL